MFQGELEFCLTLVTVYKGGRCEGKTGTVGKVLLWIQRESVKSFSKGMFMHRHYSGCSLEAVRAISYSAEVDGKKK